MELIFCTLSVVLFAFSYIFWPTNLTKIKIVFKVAALSSVSLGVQETRQLPRPPAALAKAAAVGTGLMEYYTRLEYYTIIMQTF